mgnify:FL=1|tara:strand:- start:1075 stop:1281 length:207 start_codon:yes stop_codon:yes gene_type:complete
MEKKQSQFDKMVDQILEDEIGWNKKVKDREYKLYKKDSHRVKITKIYRYLNIHGDHDERFGEDRFLEG